MLPAHLRPTRYRPFVAALPALPSVAFFGDSITDTAPWNAGSPQGDGSNPPVTAFGQWATSLANLMKWKRLNQNMIVNGSFETALETVTSIRHGFAVTAVGLPAPQRNQMHATTPGGWSLMLAPSNNPPPLPSGGFVSVAGDDGAIRLFLQPGQAYVFSCQFWIPTSLDASKYPQLLLWDRVGTSGYSFGGSVPLTTWTPGAWTKVSGTYQVRSNAVAAFLRVNYPNITSSDPPIWVDEVQLEPLTPDGLPTPYGEWDNRGAFAETTLGYYGGIIESGEQTYPVRVNAFKPNIVIMQYGMNDLSNFTTTISGGATNPYPTTLSGWQSALHTALVGITTDTNWTPNAVIVGGISNRDPVKSALPTPPPGWTTFQDFTNQMDGITEREAHNVGAFSFRCNYVPPVALLDQYGVHPTVGVGQGEEYLFNRCLAALASGV